MKSKRIAGWGIIWVLGLLGGHLMAAAALPDFLLPFPPEIATVETTPIPLRPGNASTLRPLSAERRFSQWAPLPFVLREGDRVLFLGDQLFGGELEHGYLETRLTVLYPEQNITFENLSWFRELPLVEPMLAGREGPPDDWLEVILGRVARIQPTVVFLGFGTEAALAGQDALAVFRASLDRLIKGLLTAPDYPAPRLVILSSLSLQLGTPPWADNSAAVMPVCIPYAQALWETAVEHQCEFIDLYRWSEAEARDWWALSEAERTEERALIEDRLRLTPYGYWRLTLAWENGLRWMANNWRFGYMADGSLRDGQFGIQLLHRHRSRRHASLRTLEARLPTPNPPGVIDIEPDSRPQCYIQITGLDPGLYALEVDGQRIVEGSETEWARYQVISHGPSWDQAERLRQVIVRKNELLREGWMLADAGQQLPDLLYAELQQIRKQIALLRRPVPRAYEVRRLTDQGVQPAPPSPRTPRRVTPPSPQGP